MPRLSSPGQCRPRAVRAPGAVLALVRRRAARVRSRTARVARADLACDTVAGGTVYVPHYVRQVQQQIFGSQEDGAQLVPVCVEKETA